MNLFTPADPDCPRQPDGAVELWHWVYLHGEAEAVVERLLSVTPEWRWEAPDLCVLDGPHPTDPGEYAVTLYGKPAVAVLAHRFGTKLLGGRVALLSDPVALKHARSPEQWR